MSEKKRFRTAAQTVVLVAALLDVGFARAQGYSAPILQSMTTKTQLSEDVVEAYGGETIFEYVLNGSVPLDVRTGQIIGPASFGPLTITKPVTQSTPQYTQALCEGGRIDEIELRFFSVDDRGFEILSRTITLTNALVISQQTYLPDAQDPSQVDVADHTETLSFMYDRILWRDENGGAETEWDARSGV
jgi:type VI secretion system Hcp family effector